jgi:hypothetical protein
MEKVKIEDSKLAHLILDELNKRAYKIDDFDVHKDRTGRHDLCNLVFVIDENTHIEITVEERSSISAGDSQTELHYAYKLSHGCDNFPAMSKLRKGDLLQVEDAPNNNESSLKIRLLRWGGYSDYIDHEVDHNVVENFIDEILKRLGSKDFVE